MTSPSVNSLIKRTSLNDKTRTKYEELLFEKVYDGLFVIRNVKGNLY